MPVKVGLKYCGGCNPDYDRVALVERLERALEGRIEFVVPGGEPVSLILVVAGCPTACVDLSAFRGLEIRVIAGEQDAPAFVEEVMTRWFPQHDTGEAGNVIKKKGAR
jgi:hypothetical protein